MTTTPKLTTEEKGLALIGTAEHLGDNVYAVGCQSLTGWFYLVWPKTQTQPAQCQCEHSRRNPGARCKHIWAVRHSLLQSRTPKF